MRPSFFVQVYVGDVSKSIGACHKTDIPIYENMVSKSSEI